LFLAVSARAVPRATRAPAPVARLTGGLYPSQSGFLLSLKVRELFVFGRVRARRALFYYSRKGAKSVFMASRGPAASIDAVVDFLRRTMRGPKIM